MFSFSIKGTLQKIFHRFSFKNVAELYFGLKFNVELNKNCYWLFNRIILINTIFLMFVKLPHTIHKNCFSSWKVLFSRLKLHAGNEPGVLASEFVIKTFSCVWSYNKMYENSCLLEKNLFDFRKIFLRNTFFLINSKYN